MRNKYRHIHAHGYDNTISLNVVVKVVRLARKIVRESHFVFLVSGNFLLRIRKRKGFLQV
jgi:hypothetical protein